jgi:hypothetical protein
VIVNAKKHSSIGHLKKNLWHSRLKRIKFTRPDVFALPAQASELAAVGPPPPPAAVEARHEEAAQVVLAGMPGSHHRVQVSAGPMLLWHASTTYVT